MDPLWLLLLRRRIALDALLDQEEIDYPDECDAPANGWRPYIFGEGERT